MSSFPEPRDNRASSASDASRSLPLRPLEIAVLVHVGALLLFSSWAFGGGVSWARFLISCWGSLSLLLTFAALRAIALRGESVRPALVWLCPFAGFNALVLLSCVNPSFSTHVFAGQSLLAHTGPVYPALPSTAHAATSQEHLWLFDAIYLSCFNLLIAIRRRRALRALLLVAIGNGVLLSIFGTFQKLTSNGLYFGRVPAPNPRFFATFVYANHWSAYILLLTAAGLGLLFYYLRRTHEHHFFRSAAPLGVIGLLIMAITPLLAGSRAGTLLMLGLLIAGLGHLLRRVPREKSLALPFAGLILGVCFAIGGGLYLARSTVHERWQDTQGQWHAGGLFEERLKLYGDTWHLVAEHPAFGWGLGSFEKAFQLVRPRPLEANRQYEHSYVEAHSDWLQSLAEVGLFGTVLVGLCAVLPLLSVRIALFTGSLSVYLLAGCGLILLYAWVEFPFGNPAVVVVFWLCFFCAVQHTRLHLRHSGAASHESSPA